VVGVYEFGRRTKSTRLAPILLGIVLVAFAARTLARNQDWSTPLAMDKSGVRNSPDSFKTHDALASDIFESDHSLAGINSAIAESQKEIAVIDALPDAQNTAKPFTNAGIYYERRGDELARQDSRHANPEVVQSYRKALQMLLRARSIDRLAGEQYIAGEKARGKLDSEIALPGLPQLYQELALTYVRLGDFPNALDAANETRLLSPERSDYELLSGLLLAANRKDDAAIALVEGLLMTRNNALLPRLQSLYASGLDPSGCGFLQTATGPKLNFSCEMVHNEMCKASTELADIFKKNQKPDEVANLKRQATEEFGCQRAPEN
jgi:protein O-mannosyl-transferase